MSTLSKEEASPVVENKSTQSAKVNHNTQLNSQKQIELGTLQTLETIEDVDGSVLESDSTPEESSRNKNRKKRSVTIQASDSSYTDALIKLKQYTKVFKEDATVFERITSDFRDRMQIVDADSQALSSSVDTIERYAYKEYPYKRAVKLKVEENSMYVVPSNDEDMYGVCIDVCENSNTALVIPITCNFCGYLAASDSSIKVSNKLDFDSNGMIIKAESGGKKMINIVALSDVFTIDLAEDDSTRKGQYKV
uniref:DUF228 domain-containing protein n=1 Tax=Borrelia hispanica TaxID=40835 RepID=UPI0004640AC2